jgi:hypothetical protein
MLQILNKLSHLACERSFQKKEKRGGFIKKMFAG